MSGREITAKSALTWGSILLLFVVIVGYGMWISRDLLFGIKISVAGISDGMSVSSPLIDLSGTARRATGVTVDGDPVSIDQNGAWQDTLALVPGYSIVTIGATDKFGRTKTVMYRVYYKTPSTSTETPAAVQ